MQFEQKITQTNRTKYLSEMSKYYVCEADDADEGVNKVTPCDDAETALQAANSSTAAVHFISTVNPLVDDEVENLMSGDDSDNILY